MESEKTLFCAIIDDHCGDYYESTHVEHFYARDRYAVRDHITCKLSKQWDMNDDDVEAVFEIIVYELQDFEIQTIQ